MKPLSKRALVLLSVFLGLVLILVLTAPQLALFLEEDTCRDRGGSWHYNVNECSYTENYRPD